MIRELALTLALMPTAVAAGPDYGSVQVERVVRVYDGDTFTASIPDWPAALGEDINVRIAGIDAPELRGACLREQTLARSAQHYLSGRLAGARRIELTNLRRDKYLRLLADVRVDGADVGRELVRMGLARPYDGGAKQGWCDSATIDPERP